MVVQENIGYAVGAILGLGLGFLLFLPSFGATFVPGMSVQLQLFDCRTTSFQNSSDIIRLAPGREA